MKTFIEIQNYGVINPDAVKCIVSSYEKDISIVYKDGTEERVPGDIDKVLNNTIIGILPCTVPMFNLFRKVDERIFKHEQICFFGINLKGEIKSLRAEQYEDADGCSHFVFADQDHNFEGFVSENELKYYPSIETERKVTRIKPKTGTILDTFRNVYEAAWHISYDDTDEFNPFIPDEIYQCCEGQRDTAGGYGWKWTDTP